MKNKTTTLYFPLGFFVALPYTALATAPSDFKGVVLIVVKILTAVLPVIVILAFIYFLWGLTRYLKADIKERSETRDAMINGIIALFVMSGVWGFVWILTETFIGDSGVKTPDISEIQKDWSEEIPPIDFEDGDDPNPLEDPIIDPPF